MIKPLFKWAGGKSRFIKHISPHISFYPTYNEPFFGGGAVFCYIHNNKLAEHYVINDSLTELCGIYQAIQSEPKAFIKEAKALEKVYLAKSREDRKIYYYKARGDYWKAPTSGRLFFLLKTCFNGIWQTCKASNGLFGTPSGLLNETALINSPQILEWSGALQRAEIFSGDFADVPVSSPSLIYCDPPYRESFTSYGSGFNDKDQIRVVEWCRKQNKNGNRVLLSNKTDGVFFEKEASDAKFYLYNATHTAGRRLQTQKKSGGTTFSAVKAKEVLMVWE